MKFSQYSKGPPTAILQAISAYLRSFSLSGLFTGPFFYFYSLISLRQGDSMNKKTGNKINRRYKDRLFYALFGSEERKRLTLELYNAINQTDYDNPDDLQLNTIEDVVYMGMKNDVSFLLASDLNMYEQSSHSTTCRAV